MKYGNFVRNGVEYEGLSIEKASEGGWSQKDLKDELKRVGIKYTMTDVMGNRVHSPYVGQWAIYIEAEFAEEVSDWLWGSGDLIGRTKCEQPLPDSD